MMATTQQLHLGTYAPRVQARLAALEAARVLPRIWAKEAAVWTADPAQHPAIVDRLGWLTIPAAMPTRLAELTRFAGEIRGAGFTHAVLLGMGGSSLFPEVCRQTFGAGPSGLDLAVLDSTDPSAVRAAEARAPLARTLAIISSKSGTTAEVSALARYFYAQFQTAGGPPGAHCLAITDAGTPLEALAKTWKFRRTFVLGPDTGQEIGGRFSALRFFGLVPAALMGADTSRLLARARAMLGRCGPDGPLTQNPAAQLAAAFA